MEKKKTEREKNHQRRSNKTLIGVCTQKYTQHKVFQRGLSQETNLILIFPGVKAKRDAETVQLLTPSLTQTFFLRNIREGKTKALGWSRQYELSAGQSQSGRWQPNIASKWGHGDPGAWWSPCLNCQEQKTWLVTVNSVDNISETLQRGWDVGGPSARSHTLIPVMLRVTMSLSPHLCWPCPSLTLRLFPSPPKSCPLEPLPRCDRLNYTSTSLCVSCLTVLSALTLHGLQPMGGHRRRPRPLLPTPAPSTPSFFFSS